jgi:hypothetical protein
LYKACYLSSRPLVTAGQHKSSLVSVSLTLSNHIEAGKVTGEKNVTHPDMPLCDSIADAWIGHRKRKSIPYPEASDSLIYEPLIQYLSWMVFASMNDGNARTSGHQTADDFLPRCLNP